ncbi:uncharacterized protein LOC131096935 [Melospiza georgiana]|uniref:uncharacterized protein LOC131096935 n=1 Tax=Melospiza georgiana TaxID=44398 RepID=UPI0025ABF6DE|nr:uncharacterized protein LOC131096935 [Melospiza georgiana]
MAAITKAGWNLLLLLPKLDHGTNSKFVKKSSFNFARARTTWLQSHLKPALTSVNGQSGLLTTALCPWAISSWAAIFKDELLYREDFAEFCSVERRIPSGLCAIELLAVRARSPPAPFCAFSSRGRCEGKAAAALARLSAARLPRSGQGNRVPCEPCQDSSALVANSSRAFPATRPLPALVSAAWFLAVPDGPAARPCRLHQERKGSGATPRRAQRSRASRGPKRQDRTSRKDAKTCKKGFTRTRRQQRRGGEEGGDVASVGRKSGGIHLKNLNVDDGQNLKERKKKRVPVDVILQGDERNIPKWITVPTPSSSKSRRSTLPGLQSHLKPALTSVNGQSGLLTTALCPWAISSWAAIFKDELLYREDFAEFCSVERRIPSGLCAIELLAVRARSPPAPFCAFSSRGRCEGKAAAALARLSAARLPRSGQGNRVPCEPCQDSSALVANSSRAFPATRPLPALVSAAWFLAVPDGPAARPCRLHQERKGSGATPRRAQRSRASRGPKRQDRTSRKDAKTCKKGFTRTRRQQRRGGEEGGDVASVGRKSGGIHLKNLNVDDGQNLKERKKKRVPVDVILQGDERNIPKWITIPTPSSSKSRRSTLPGQELLGNRAGVCRKKLEFSNECSSSKYPQLQHSAVPLPSNTVASPRHRPCPEVNMTSCDSILGGYQSADEGCSFSSTDLSALYPAMVAILAELMTKHSQRKVLKYMFGHLRSKRRHSRRPKLNVTVDKMRESGSCKRKPKKASHSMCSRRSEDNQNPTFGNERREFSSDSCPISNSSALGSYACADTNETKMHYSDSSLEQHLASGKSQEVCKHTAFPDVMDRMEETFLVEDKLQTIASPKNSEYIEGEKFTYKLFSEPSFRTSAASSDSRAFHLVKESKTQKADFCVGTSELCSCACSSHGNRDNSVSTINFSPARSTNTSFIWPQKITSSQHKESFSSWKQNSSKRDEEIDAAFDKLYYRVISGEYLKPSTSTRPLLNSQSHEEKGTLVRSNLSDSERSLKQRDTELEKLCGKSVPKFPGLQRASNFRKYEEIQMPETVNALVNSPVRTYSSISSAKRAGNFQNHPLCSPVKRLKFKPEYCSSSSKCQEISRSKEGNLQTSGMDFLSTYNCSQPSVFADRNFHCQGFGSHDSSQQSSLGISGTSLQESGTAGAHSGWPGAMENRSSLRSGSERHSRGN